MLQLQPLSEGFITYLSALLVLRLCL